MREAAAAALPATPMVEPFTRGLRRLALALFLAAIALALYAAFERRGLHADGAAYLMRLLEQDSFVLPEPARRAVLILLQTPAVAAVRFGLADLAGAGFVFCLTLELAPPALLALCYAALPAERKHFFYFPLLHYLAAGLSASASPIVEGSSAAPYFWLVLYVVLFRASTPPGLGLAAVLAIPTLWVHEAMGGLALVLATAALWRARRECSAGRRAVFVVLAAWFGVVAAVQIGNILVPKGAGSRDDLLAGFLGLWWLIDRVGGVNAPAWLGLFALLAVNVVPMANRRATRWIVGGFGALAVAGAALAAAAPGTVSPAQHFGARANPAIFALFLALGALGTVWRPERARLWTRPPVLAVCAMLGASSLVWHAFEVKYWSLYLDTIRKVLVEQRGLVRPQAIEAALAPRERDIFRAMAWDWVFPELSVVLAPGGKIVAIIARERPVHWRTWDPADAAQVPKSRYWDASGYRAAASGR